MATFFVAGEFPSFKPIRLSCGKALQFVEAKLPLTSDVANKAILETLKSRLSCCATDKVIYLTIQQANLLGIV